MMTSTSSVLWSFGICSKLQRWKRSINECVPHELTTNPKKKKKSLLWSVVFSYFTQQWITSQSDCGTCDTKRTVYHNHWQTTQLDWEKLQSTSQSQVKAKVAQSCLTLCNAMDYMVHGILKARILEWVAFPFSRGSSQARDLTQVSCIAGRFFTRWATREDKFAPKNVMVIVWWSTACLIHHSFLNLAKPLRLWSRLSKSMRCTNNCNACSWHWSAEWFQFFSMTTPNHTLYNQHFKSWTNWVTKFCFICRIHLTSRQRITTSSSISTAFCLLQVSQLLFAGKMIPQPAEGRICFPRICQIPKHKFLC